MHLYDVCNDCIASSRQPIGSDIPPLTSMHSSGNTGHSLPPGATQGYSSNNKQRSWQKQQLLEQQQQQIRALRGRRKGTGRSKRVRRRYAIYQGRLSSGDGIASFF